MTLLTLSRKLGLLLALAIAAAAGPAAAKASAANPASKAGVVEVVTFALKDGVTPAEFRAFDRAVERQHVARQPGFVSRESAAGDNGQWLVIVHWRTVRDAEASMASFMQAPAAQAFMGKLRAETMKMTRYSRQQ